MKIINKDQALDAIKNGEFGADITGSADKVAIILTQSWCPQWQSMKRFVVDFTGAEIFFLEYDLTGFFDEFIRFKENRLGNDQIPYIRYYIGGSLVADTNAVSENIFRRKFIEGAETGES